MSPPARPSVTLSVTALAALAAGGACSRGGGGEARQRLEARGAAAAPASFDFADPGAALAMTAEEAAWRIGSLEQASTVGWVVTRSASTAPAPGPAAPPAEPLRVRAGERHLVRQLAGGDFQVQADIDPGTGPGEETGKELLFVGGRTYARSRHAAWRARPTDRGADARSFREQSFRLALDLAALLGPALTFTPRGEGTLLGRPARRYGLTLVKGAAGSAAAPAGTPDEDTRRRLEFLEGRVPLALDGELVLDGRTGVPLAVRMRAAFGEKGDPRLRADVDLEARISALGGTVPPLAPPRGALADERKPRGVARALEQAGLRRRGDAGEPEPGDEDEPAAEGE